MDSEVTESSVVGNADQETHKISTCGISLRDDSVLERLSAARKQKQDIIREIEHLKRLSAARKRKQDIIRDIEHLERHASRKRSRMSFEKVQTTPSTKTRKRPLSSIERMERRDSPKRFATSDLSIHGLQNEDCVSCYANSVIQALYTSPIMRSVIKSEPSVSKTLKHHLKRYEHKKNAKTRRVRKSVGEIYGEREQQDCVQFLEELLFSEVSLKSVMAYTRRQTIHCQQCNYTSATDVQETITRLPMRSSTETVEGLFTNYVNCWEALDDYTCVSCHAKGKAQYKHDITSSNDLMAMQFLIFNNQQMKNLKYELEAVPESELHIAGHCYKPIAGIFHHGSTIQSGHYTAFVKRGTKWFCANDSKVYESKWPKGSKNLYMLLMAKE